MFDETVQKYQGKIQAQLSAMKVQIDLSRGCGGDKVKTEKLRTFLRFLARACALCKDSRGRGLKN